MIFRQQVACQATLLAVVAGGVAHNLVMAEILPLPLAQAAVAFVVEVVLAKALAVVAVHLDMALCQQEIRTF